MSGWGGRWALGSLAALMLCGPARAEEGGFEFALIGDTPYSAYHRAQLPKILDALGAERLEFIIHDGDFKDGSSACSDAVFADRLAVFNASAHPFVFVPGDNEWTDCHRFTAGGFDPLERLAKLREMFFPTPKTLGKRRFAVETQASLQPAHAEYREHLRWRRGAVLFVTLNVPGSQNNIGSGAEPSAEFVDRSAAVSAWMKDSFTLARAQGMKGVVLVMQADPDFAAHRKGRPKRGYGDLLNQLAAEVARFSGQVMLVHGDSHELTIDQPLRKPGGAVVENFTRVETFGHPFAGWVQVRVDERAPMLFTLTPKPWGGD